MDVLFGGKIKESNEYSSVKTIGDQHREIEEQTNNSFETIDEKEIESLISKGIETQPERLANGLWVVQEKQDEEVKGNDFTENFVVLSHVAVTIRGWERLKTTFSSMFGLFFGELFGITYYRIEVQYLDGPTQLTWQVKFFFIFFNDFHLFSHSISNL